MWCYNALPREAQYDIRDIPLFVYNTCSQLCLFKIVASSRLCLRDEPCKFAILKAIKRPCLNFANPVWFEKDFEPPF